jgi:hypothetical protein
MSILFTILVVLGFLGRLLGASGVNHADKVAWAVWFAAAIIWAVQRQ